MIDVRRLAAISAGDDDVIRNNRVRTGSKAVSLAPGTAQRYKIEGGNVAFVQIVGIGTVTNTAGGVIQNGALLDDAIQASIKLDFTDFTGINHIIISVSITASNLTTVSVWGET